MKNSLCILILCLGGPIIAEIQTYKFYKVKEKDTVYSIAQKFSVSPKELFNKEGKSLETLIHPGDSIKIPENKNPGIGFTFPLAHRIKIDRGFSPVAFAPMKGIIYHKSSSKDVFSSAEGKVVAIDFMEGYENYVILLHKNGYSSVYGNLKEVHVTEGQKVKRQENLGKLFPDKGLYFQINLNLKPIDPLNVLHHKL
ncbi:MAG: LysM peptidoglycan-binding domain-containing M23 family metallopeptidase [Leptospira sp.]|nr:LysM peptidoglycan-binding domain-containing M23 family metallopeptidase [Leptospira sp.]